MHDFCLFLLSPVRAVTPLFIDFILTLHILISISAWPESATFVVTLYRPVVFHDVVPVLNMIKLHFKGERQCYFVQANNQALLPHPTLCQTNVAEMWPDS